ncbi:CLUMA_CG004663, isoform A [Clunio marinus]|uniref:CLUMA_CG004663, isoform A n=1 Tax=Clunio marinus TaxID=568069 RepID=A0A1J1HWR8_9DIPT|nr:CLUMA_CG004663, isoform A [Clunio marinus]
MNRTSYLQTSRPVHLPLCYGITLNHFRQFFTFVSCKLALPLAFPSEISENHRGINLPLTVDAMILPHMPLTLNKATIRQLKKFFTSPIHN